MMKKVMFKLISVSVALSILFSLASCKKQEQVPQEEEVEISSTKATQQPVQILELPTGEEELVEMLNSAVGYIEHYCYYYTKNIKCEVSNLSVGSLSAAGKDADDAFKSIFGEKDITMNYDYNTSRDTFSANFPSNDFTADEVSLITAEQKDDEIILTAVFPDETNPTDASGVLHRLCSDYQNSDDIAKALSDFKASAESTSITASDITVKATICAQDSSLRKLEVSYTQRYTLSGVTLVKLEGSAVTGTAKTTVIYSAMGA